MDEEKQDNSKQITVVVLLIVLLALEAVRSPNVRTFFASIANRSNASLSATAHGQSAPKATATTQLDWKIGLYWGIAALILIAISSRAPGVATAFIVLIIVEQVLVNWQQYKPLLGMPTAK